MNKTNPESNENSTLFLGSVLLLLMAGYQKIAPNLIYFYHAHRLLILFVLISFVGIMLVFIGTHLWNKFVTCSSEKAVTSHDSTSILLGKNEFGETLFLKQAFRTSHTQVIGTTSAGKTKSVILPFILKDIENGNGMLIIDGKSDLSFLEELYANVVSSGRAKDFRLFSLSNIKASQSFNPLVNGSSQEVAERVFSSFRFENEYYRNIQYEIFLNIIRLIHDQNHSPNIRLVQRLLTGMQMLKTWIEQSKDEDLKRHLIDFLEQPQKDRNEKISGLNSHLNHFLGNEISLLFNAESSGIEMNEVLEKKLICYFQLPTMYYPTLAEVTGKLALQCFQSAVAKRHLGHTSKPRFFSCYLDDFQDYIYEGFAALLNKSRSANIGVIFSHQALGDLEKVSRPFKNIVLTNTNLKIVMRNNDPETCEYFSKSFGTKTSEKVTERRVNSLLGENNTGEGSVREVEEFIYHPNAIRQLKIGEAIVSIPHATGVKLAKIQFRMRPELAPVPLPEVPKSLAPIPVQVTSKEVS